MDMEMLGILLQLRFRCKTDGPFAWPVLRLKLEGQGLFAAWLKNYAICKGRFELQVFGQAHGQAQGQRLLRGVGHYERAIKYILA